MKEIDSLDSYIYAAIGAHDDATIAEVRARRNSLPHSTISVVFCFNCTPWWNSGMLRFDVYFQLMMLIIIICPFLNVNTGEW